MTIFISLTLINLATPKAGAENELLFNKLASAYAGEKKKIFFTVNNLILSKSENIEFNGIALRHNRGQR